MKKAAKKAHKKVSTIAKKSNQKRSVKKDTRAKQKAEYLATLPKGRLKRTLHRLHPKRQAKYWFSKDGGIMALKLAGVGIAALGLFMFGLFAYYRKDLPTNFAELQACISGQTTSYYDRTGETLLWESQGDVDCTPVALDEISPNLVNAVLAIEDKDFYDHGGFSGTGVARAAWNNVRGGNTQGGSTITQQYVKNAILKNNEQRYSRKIKELILAIELERSFTKNEILNAYLNVASFGSVYDGIEAASRGYFEKSASDLTIDEAALLAAAIPAPTLYWNNPDTHAARQDFVLGLMLEQGKISQEEYDEAVEVDTLAKVVDKRGQYENIIAPHYVLEVEKQLVEKYGEGVKKLGLSVTTALDLEAQEIVEAAIDDNISKVEAIGLDNAASVVVDVETGQVAAMMGSRDFEYEGFGQNNYATSGALDPGSSYKAYDFAALFAYTNDWGPGSTLYDYRTQFQPGWTPKSWDNGEYGPMSARRALGQSRNPPAIKAMYIAGIDKTIELASALGVKTPPPCQSLEFGCGLAASIGSGVELRMDEHTNAYASLSRLGEYKPMTYIMKVVNADGEVLDEWMDDESEQVLDPEAAYLVNHMLADDSVRIISNGYYAVPGVRAAMKTGTTDFYKHNWIMGYSKTYSVSVWVGHHDGTLAFRNISTNRSKTSIYKDIMSNLHEGLPEDAKNDWDRPEGIKTVRIDRASGYQSGDGVADIFPSWYIPKRQDDRPTADIDTVSGKRATECTPARAITTVTGGNILAELPESDPSFDNWMNPVIKNLGTVVGGEIPTEEDDIHNCDDIRPTISVASVPGTCQDTCSFSVNVTGGTHALSTVNFKIDDQIIPGGSIAVSANGVVSVNYTVPVNGVGSRTFSAEVVDVALYDASVSAAVEFEKQDPIQFDPAGDGVTVTGINIQVNWSRVSSDLSIEFGGACSGDTTLSASNSSSTFTAPSRGITLGSTGDNCTATLKDNSTTVDTASFTI